MVLMKNNVEAVPGDDSVVKNGSKFIGVTVPARPSHVQSVSALPGRRAHTVVPQRCFGCQLSSQFP